MNETLFSNLRSLLMSESFAVLATAGDDQPHCSLVAFAVSDDLRRLIFATPKDTLKYDNLCRNGQVGLLVDNREKHTGDLGAVWAVTVSGRAASLESGSEPLVEVYERKYPELARFIRAADTGVFAVEVESCRVVQGFERVLVWRPE